MGGTRAEIPDDDERGGQAAIEPVDWRPAKTTATAVREEYENRS